MSESNKLTPASLAAFCSGPSVHGARRRAHVMVGGARYYVHASLLLLDTPTLALAFLRRQNQDQSEFTLESTRTTRGTHVAIVRFKARETSRVMPVPEGAITTGRFWIDVATGTVRQTELTVTGKAFTFKATTRYEAERTVGVWVPVEAVQQADIRGEGIGVFSDMGAAGGEAGAWVTLEGRARYSKFRRALEQKAPRMLW